MPEKPSKGLFVLADPNVTNKVAPGLNTVVRTTHYENSLPGIAVSITHRNGFASVIRPTTSFNQQNESFRIVDRYQVPAAMAGAQLAHFASQRSEHRPYATALHNGLNTAMSGKNASPNPSRYEFVIITELHKSDLASAIDGTNTLYLTELDLTVAIYQDGDTFTHPYVSAELEIKQTDPNSNYSSFNVVVVNNDIEPTSKYIMIGKHVYRLTTTRDDTATNGVYIMVRVCDNGTEIVERQKYDLATAGAVLGIYDTKAEAVEAGDVAAARDLAVAQLEAKNAAHLANERKLKYDAERAAAEHKQTLLETELRHKRALQDMDMRYAAAKYDHEWQSRNDDRYYAYEDYERRSNRESQSNRSSSFIETMKVVGGAIGLGLVVTKLIL